MAAATAAVDAAVSVASTILRSIVSRVSSRDAVSRGAFRYAALAHMSRLGIPTEAALCTDRHHGRMDRYPDFEHDLSLQRAFLERMIDQHAVIASDIVRIASDHWVIHGVVHDGEDVMMAKFLDRGHAWETLVDLKPGPSAPAQDVAR
jgi:hypothetical protein